MIDVRLGYCIRSVLLLQSKKFHDHVDEESAINIALLKSSFHSSPESLPLESRYYSRRQKIREDRNEVPAAGRQVHCLLDCRHESQPDVSSGIFDPWIKCHYP